MSCFLLMEKLMEALGCKCSQKDALIGRAIAQAVSHWLPTAATRVRAQVWQVGFVVDKVALGQVFSEYFSFPLPIFIPPNSPSLQSPRAGTSGPSSTPHYANKMH
jgi:hypothetical protein